VTLKVLRSDSFSSVRLGTIRRVIEKLGQLLAGRVRKITVTTEILVFDVILYTTLIS
jgi:hypothetical protein